SLQSGPLAPPVLRGMDRDDQVARLEDRREVRGRRRAGGAGARASIVADSDLSRGSLNSTNEKVTQVPGRVHVVLHEELAPAPTWPPIQRSLPIQKLRRAIQ